MLNEFHVAWRVPNVGRASMKTLMLNAPDNTKIGELLEIASVAVREFCPAATVFSVTPMSIYRRPITSADARYYTHGDNS